MKALTFTINLLEPLLINDICGGDPNSAVGLDFIPGSSIRGAIIGRYFKKKGEDSVDANDEEFKALFLDGSVRFLNAYPLTKNKKRTLPTPYSWYAEKDKNNNLIHNFAIEKEETDINWENISSPFCHLSENDDGEGQVRLFKPVYQAKIHIFRSNRQKVTTGESTIFRYQALEVGQIYSGVIISENEPNFEEIKNLLGEGSILNLGKSHLVSYGQVKINDIKIFDNWEEYQSVGDEAEDKIIVTLLSDTIIRDENTGAYITNVDSALRLGLDAEHEKAFVRKRIRGSFNKKWNLPTPQFFTIKAGSVFVYKKNPELATLLETLQVDGIGERKEEGYGRIAINWHQLHKIAAKEGELSFSLIPDPGLTNEYDLNLAHTIVKRITREKLDGALVRTVNNLVLISPIPKKSQLSRMRVVARKALATENPGLIVDHLAQMKKSASDQFQNARIKKKSLGKWIECLSKDSLSVWDELEINCDRLPSLGKTKLDLNDNILALEYTVRLIDAVLHKASKEGDNE